MCFDEFLRSMSSWVDEFWVDDISFSFEDFSSLTRPTLICFHSWWQQCNFYLIWILMRLFTQASKSLLFHFYFLFFSILWKWMEELKLKARLVLHFQWNFATLFCYYITIENRNHPSNSLQIHFLYIRKELTKQMFLIELL